jgi:hypothetical protein
LGIVLLALFSFYLLGWSNLLHGKPIPKDGKIFLACLNRIFLDKQGAKRMDGTENLAGQFLAGKGVWGGIFAREISVRKRSHLR